MKVLICTLLLISYASAGRLRYVLDTDGGSASWPLDSQQIRVVKRASPNSHDYLCPSFSALRCPNPDVGALCREHRLTNCETDFLTVDI